MRDLTAEDFDAYVHQTFVVVHEASELALSLAHVDRLKPIRPEGRAPFSLLFRGPATPVLPQAVYSFRHPHLGALEIFIVPVAARNGGVDYQAVFA